LRAEGLIDDAHVSAIAAQAEARAAALRAGMNAERSPDADDLFRYVFAEPTSQLCEQHRQLREELAAAAEDD
jgi:2-oxoisovalerate dehydrogenase E1 component alpha subunit